MKARKNGTSVNGITGKSRFWDAEPYGMLEEGPCCLMEEDGWFLYDFNAPEGKYETSSMWHRCPNDKDNVEGDHPNVWGKDDDPSLWPVRYMDAETTTFMEINHIPPAWKCVYCFAIPPDKILTLFLLHNFDRLAK